METPTRAAARRPILIDHLVDKSKPFVDQHTANAHHQHRPRFSSTRSLPRRTSHRPQQKKWRAALRCARRAAACWRSRCSQVRYPLIRSPLLVGAALAFFEGGRCLKAVHGSRCLLLRGWMGRAQAHVPDRSHWPLCSSLCGGCLDASELGHACARRRRRSSPPHRPLRGQVTHSEARRDLFSRRANTALEHLIRK